MRIFPEVVAEGKVDFEKLKTTLGEIVDDRPERYSFAWAGKRDAVRLLQVPSRGTLKPCLEESVDWETTKNLFIGGENLEVLKLLYKSYAGRVKMIYIDPPYNTGNDFIYPDDFADPLDAYLKLTAQKDAEGNLLTSNPETSGRYHSAWLSMMYPRVFIARQILREDGVIFISIGDEEFANLRLILDEIFGEENFVATIAWQKTFAKKNKALISGSHDHILVYTRQLSAWTRNLIPRDEEQLSAYKNPDRDPRGKWQSVSFSVTTEDPDKRKPYRYKIKLPSEREVLPPAGRHWNGLPGRYKELLEDNRIWFGPDGDNLPRVKVFLTEVQAGIVPDTWWPHDEVGSTQDAKKEVLQLFEGEEPFSTPKPTALIERMLQIATSPGDNDIVMDFFAGSGTTAESVLNLNEKDGGTRRFLLIQLPEPISHGSCSTIAEVSKERVRRVIRRHLQKEQGNLKMDLRAGQGDLGFRVYKLAESNYRQWRGLADKDGEKYAEEMDLFTDPLLPGWKPEDVLWEVALKEGFSLSSTIEEQMEVKSNRVWRVTDADRGQSFLICLDDKLKDASVKALKLGKEDLLVCRDAALTDEQAANYALTCKLKTI